LKIKILGTRGEIPESAPYHSKHSGILIDQKLLIDLGEKSFLEYKPRWILISHFHPDHAYFVRKGHEEVPKTQAKIFAPEKSKHVKIEIFTGKRRLEDYEITSIPTHHSKNVKSQAYLIRKGSRSLLYTSDLVWIDKEYRSLYQGVDLVITEASFLRKNGMVRKDMETGMLYGHNGIPNLVRMFKDAAKTILFVHFGSWFYESVYQARQKIRNLGKEYGVHTLVGYDGMELIL
jgi:ribonuclease BN (tRNA processing enzyme)